MRQRFCQFMNLVKTRDYHHNSRQSIVDISSHLDIFGSFGNAEPSVILAKENLLAHLSLLSQHDRLTDQSISSHQASAIRSVRT